MYLRHRPSFQQQQQQQRMHDFFFLNSQNNDLTMICKDTMAAKSSGQNQIQSQVESHTATATLSSQLIKKKRDIRHSVLTKE